MGAKALSIANTKVNLNFGEAFFRGVGCNWLVCLAVWIAVSSKDITGKILGIYFPIMAFVALGFEHSIANMFFIPMGLLLKNDIDILTISGLTGKLGDLTLRGFFVNNLIPVTF
ncbi:putative formate transporter 1 [subsurface metagenome]